MSAIKQRIDSLLIEPGCATNQAKSDKARKEGCKKPLTPGAAAGGCAFDGAKIALQPVVDVEAVCKAASEKFGKPVIPVNAPGFAGSKNLGNKLGGEALLDHVVGTMEPEHTTACDINLIGEYNVVGEFWQVKPLFDELGIRVLASFCGDASMRKSTQHDHGGGCSVSCLSVLSAAGKASVGNRGRAKPRSIPH